MADTTGAGASPGFVGDPWQRAAAMAATMMANRRARRASAGRNIEVVLRGSRFAIRSASPTSIEEIKEVVRR